MEVLTHEQLLTLMHRLEAAADDHDPRRLGRTCTQLRAALHSHMRSERPLLERLPRPQREVVEDGQQEILDLLHRISEASAQAALRLSHELTAVLVQQIRIERRLLRDFVHESAP